ncbi:unnamed protein product [Cuscuta epithymum]|uniref:Uncharacterized protein n=1 Tax=Cuscuta epithymum TaxID=186058 RepID=A0AAV0EMZ8_9ASTE|nr:unnamed protein product [Cuscuta epithymum]
MTCSNFILNLKGKSNTSEHGIGKFLAIFFYKGFLRSCSDMKDRLQIFHGKEDVYFVTRGQPFLHQIQMTFELKWSTIFFLKHGRGRALQLAMSSCRCRGAAN